MKKLLIFLFAFILCVSLAACGEPEPTGSTPTDGSESTAPTEPTTLVHTHIWTEATCEVPKTCFSCVETEGETAAHSYEESSRVDATSLQDGSVTYTCAVCGDSYGEVLCATGSEGLAYEDNGDGTMTMVGLGACTDGEISKYK